MARMNKSDLHWLSLAEVKKRYGLPARTCRKYFDEMTASGRYPDGIIIRTPRTTLVLDAAIHDFLKNAHSIRLQVKIAPYDAEAERLELMRLAI